MTSYLQNTMNSNRPYDPASPQMNALQEPLDKRSAVHKHAESGNSIISSQLSAFWQPHSVKNSLSWFPHFRTDKFPWLFQYFLSISSIFSVFYTDEL